MLERSRRRSDSADTIPLPAAVAPTHAFPKADANEILITAIGHSTFLLQVGGLNILTDPVWSERCSPVQWAGPRRRHAPGVALDALPPIDLVLQSHDHYDHFDDATVRWLARNRAEALWCAPLGVGARLRSRGVRRVIECDWWESAEVAGSTVTCLPAAHFSGRTPLDRDTTLWSGWAITVGGRRIYFVGDTGMHPLFGEIGARLGPCDAVLMPIGAYEPRWFMRPVHLDPDDALEAFEALTARHPTHPTVMVAMHWGTFELTDEPADEPPRRARDGWRARGWDPERLWIFAPGETRRLRSGR